ncbi:TraR/DksA C4-type zinc finger protein [Serpentinicella alkaliphila]|uniref:TraR/DksA family transcriptional regulator n=1 Tax=Serpentinicella alkaliphila TaxID=1734049 RepID=A0A4R2T7B4_9FIRM|nr:TraR/DksA C4-type zinc finger protein [Serpentinicella alkaliphila]QUH26122.1 TraR/DksA C4-type zinc finger protein [Serpentinicella alkaliphila]TCP98430.1 TraR/DksA family transcriptional regulator [Serpentinicella alkaliphila]
MDKKKLKHYKELLLDEKKEVLDTLERMEDHQKNSASMREYTEELSAYDNHPADLGTEMFMTSMQANLENHERYRTTEIDRALESIDAGTYGKCNLCGSFIAEARLEVMPEANICMECAKKKVPIEDIIHYRPVEEELLSPPFGRTYKDLDNNYSGFDGEDAYQEVAKFNQVKNDPSFSTADNIDVFDDYSLGTVQDVEKITNEHYEDQIPD